MIHGPGNATPVALNAIHTDEDSLMFVDYGEELGRDTLAAPKNRDTLAAPENYVLLFDPESTPSSPWSDQVTTKVSWLRKASLELDTLRLLPEDWDGYGAPSPGNFAYLRAIDILHHLHVLEEITFEPASVDPSAAGGICISFAQAERRAIIECHNDGDVMAIVYAYDGEPDIWTIPESKIEEKDSLFKINGFLDKTPYPS